MQPSAAPRCAASSGGAEQAYGTPGMSGARCFDAVSGLKVNASNFVDVATGGGTSDDQGKGVAATVLSQNSA